MAYTAGDVLCRVELGAASGLPRDMVVNDFAFRHTDETEPDETDLTALASCLAGFYIDTPTGQPAKLGQFLSSQLSRATDACHIKCYRIVVGLLGPPALDYTFTLPATYGGVTAGLPAEVAIVNSIHGDLTGLSEEVAGTRPAARRRGRQYIGPLMSSADVIDYSVAPPRVKSTIRDIILAASDDLQGEALVQGFTWSVWSRALVDLVPVTGGFVDNDFDTIRGRQQRATSRGTWSV